MEHHDNDGRQQLKNRKKLSTGAIVGIALGGVVATVITILLILAAITLNTYNNYSTSEDKARAVQQLARPEENAAGNGNPAREADTGAVEATPVDTIRAKLKIDFSTLKSQNPDVAGWIYVHDTVIDYPVMRGSDNQRYVKYGFDGEPDKSGAIFFDCRNTGVFAEQNSVVYGHNMKNGSIFHVLEEYRDQAFFDAHKLMFFVTEQNVYKLDIFSVFVTTELNDYRTRTFATESAYQTFIDTYSAKSLVKTNVDMTAKDRMVTLSTCDAQYSEDLRIVAMAKLTEIADIDTYDFDS